VAQGPDPQESFGLVVGATTTTDCLIHSFLEVRGEEDQSQAGAAVRHSLEVAFHTHHRFHPIVLGAEERPFREVVEACSNCLTEA